MKSSVVKIDLEKSWDFFIALSTNKDCPDKWFSFLSMRTTVWWPSYLEFTFQEILLKFCQLLFCEVFNLEAKIEIVRFRMYTDLPYCHLFVFLWRVSFSSLLLRSKTLEQCIIPVSFKIQIHLELRSYVSRHAWTFEDTSLAPIAGLFLIMQNEGFCLLLQRSHERIGEWWLVLKPVLPLTAGKWLNQQVAQVEGFFFFAW